MNNKSIFETKEQYLAFRAAFAAAQNDKRAKPTFVEVPCSAYDWRTRETKSWMGKEKHKGWLQAQHFILLNAVRGLPLNRGFTPATNANKIASYYNNPTEGFDWALGQLKARQNDAKELIAGVKVDMFPFMVRNLERMSPEEKQAELDAMKKRKEESLRRPIDKLLEPLAGTFTLEQLASLDLGGEK